MKMKNDDQHFLTKWKNRKKVNMKAKKEALSKNQNVHLDPEVLSLQKRQENACLNPPISGNLLAYPRLP